MDRTASNRGLARQLRVSETAVRRAEKTGRIRREPDGAWDLAKVRAAWAGNTEHGETVSAGGMTFMQARTANEVLKAQERRVRLQRMKGELVDRAKASRRCSGLPATSGMPGSTGRHGWRR